MSFTQKVLDSLTRAADKIAQDARGKASWSSRIPNAIQVENAVDNGGGIYEIDIVVDLKVAPHAAAFEFGSGIHRTRGEPAKYKIKHKNSPVLAFEWPGHEPPWGSPKFVGMAGEKFLFLYVDHPGVEANPYLRPAATDNKQYTIDLIKRTTGSATLKMIVGKEEL